MSNMKSRFLSSIISIALLLSMLYIMPTSSTVHANTRTVADGVYRIKNVMSGKYMDVRAADKASGTNVIQWQFNAGQQMMWQVTFLNNGAYRLTPLHAPDLALNAEGGSSASGTNVNVTTSNGSTAQQWTIVSNNDGTFRIAPIYASNSVLDVAANGVWDNGGNIALWSSHNGDNQKWVFESAQTVQDGVYLFKSVHSGKYMDIDANLNVYQWSYHGGSRQQWRVTYLNNGFYRIMSLAGSNWTLDISGASPDDGANAQIYGYSESNAAQQFAIFRNSDGTYGFAPRCAMDKVLDVQSGSLANGGNILSWKYYSTSNNQKWIPEQVYEATVNHYFDDGYYVYNGLTKAQTISKLQSYQNELKRIFLDGFNLSITSNTPTSYRSSADICKGTVNSSNIDKLCTSHTPSCTDRITFRDKIRSALPGSNKVTTAYWSNNHISADWGSNRSFSSGFGIFMLERGSSDNSNIGVLTHEMAHQYGAPDHYHEILTGGACRGGSICSECGTEKRDKFCIMNVGRPSNITTKLVSEIFCKPCKTDVINHLNGHHKKL